MDEIIKLTCELRIKVGELEESEDRAIALRSLDDFEFWIDRASKVKIDEKNP